MVYESDFYTTRRSYSRPSYSTYSVTRRRIDWSKHPTVPRPSLIPEPVTAFAARRPAPHTPSVSSAATVVRVPLPVPVHRRVNFQGLPGTSIIRRY